MNSGSALRVPGIEPFVAPCLVFETDHVFIIALLQPFAALPFTSIYRVINDIETKAVD